MDIFKIIATGLIGGILTVAVRQYKKEYAILTALATGVALLFMISDTLEQLVASIRLLTDKTGIDGKFVSVVMKVVGIGYITEFGAQILRDSGEGAIAAKVELGGKVCILALTLPIMSYFLEVCLNALSSV